jgi:phospholipid/cholesterol/gamma-HCH transport system substrate-binding protein
MSGGAGVERVWMEVRRSAKSTILYLTLLFAGIVVGLGIIDHLTGTKFWDGYTTYRIAFDDVKGVVASRTALRLDGVPAGAVTGVQLVHGEPVVTISLEHQYAPLYRNARVTLRPNTPLEDMYIDITSRGSRSAGALGSSEILPPQQTTSPVDISSVLDVLQPSTRLDVSTVLQELSQGTADRGASLRAAFVQLAPFLASTQRLSIELEHRHGELADLVHNFQGLTGVLGTRDRQIATLVSAGNSTLSAAAANNTALGQTIQ